jgi:ribosome-associated translation inhibitor RaiA/cold shock CspA family protein
MDTSEAVAARIRERAEELERFFDRIISCRVVVECRHPRRLQGNLFRVRVDLKVPGREIAVGRDPAAHHAHEDVCVAIRDAFDTTRRLLEDHAREARGDHGRITRLLPGQNCGFILSADGNAIYFHRNSVANGGFDKLAVGDEVRFVAHDAESAEGSQASTVMPLGKHHFPPVEAVRG